MISQAPLRSPLMSASYRTCSRGRSSHASRRSIRSREREFLRAPSCFAAGRPATLGAMGLMNCVFGEMGQHCVVAQFPGRDPFFGKGHHRFVGHLHKRCSRGHRFWLRDATNATALQASTSSQFREITKPGANTAIGRLPALIGSTRFPDGLLFSARERSLALGNRFAP
jgi:hypothetical protein